LTFKDYVKLSFRELGFYFIISTVPNHLGLGKQRRAWGDQLGEVGSPNGIGVGKVEKSRGGSLRSARNSIKISDDKERISHCRKDMMNHEPSALAWGSSRRTAGNMFGKKRAGGDVSQENLKMDAEMCARKWAKKFPFKILWGLNNY